MKIKEVYKKFGIPPNLQEHMMRVCGIVDFVQKHWNGDNSVDWNLTRRIALLHDLGNTVKFDLDKHPEFLGDEQVNVYHWKKVQADVIEKYSSDDHNATKQMLEEIDFDKQSIATILDKSFGNSVATMNSSDWSLKIVYYADLRTLPFGIGTLEERLNDVKERMPKYTSRPDFEELVEACRTIEKQLQQNLDVPISDIKNESVSFDVKELLELEI